MFKCFAFLKEEIEEKIIRMFRKVGKVESLTLLFNACLLPNARN